MDATSRIVAAGLQPPLIVNEILYSVKLMQCCNLFHSVHANENVSHSGPPKSLLIESVQVRQIATFFRLARIHDGNAVSNVPNGCSHVACARKVPRPASRHPPHFATHNDGDKLLHHVDTHCDHAAVL
eukprot:TRINITY_DN3153_c0_g2_i2.p2 TRINITY_DN3153_c0_g2~~TRINITY_DN3153_c0_g2_i2.p2  ORF type:complete len:128 (+),score=4.39 TRINITY_DN3153_c0_g2_i2:134-517(+)